MTETNPTAASKTRWPWWLGGVALLAVTGVLARFISRACCGGKTEKGKKPEGAVVG